MSFLRNTAGVFVTSSLIVPIGLLTSIVLARYLSVEARGVYAMAVAFAAMTALLAQLGWPSASIYRLRRIRSDPAQVAGAGLISVGVIACLVLAACVTLEPVITERFLAGAPRSVFTVALGFIPVELLAHLVGALARGTDRFRLWNTIRLANALLTLLAVAVILIVTKAGMIWALGGSLAINVITTGILAVAVLRETGVSRRFRSDEIWESLRFGLKNYLQGMAGELHERVDLFMLAYLLADPRQLAYYAIAVGLVHRLKLLPGSIRTASYPRMAGLSERDASDFACRASRQSLAVVLVTAVGLASTAHFLIPFIFGGDYRHSVPPTLILIPGMALLTIYTVLGNYFTAMNHQRVNIASQLLSVAVNVLLNLWWIPRFGILGAAFASLISYALEAAMITVSFLLFSQQSLRAVLILGRDDLDAVRERFDGALRRLRPTR